MSESDIPLPEAEEAVLPVESRHDEDDRLKPEFVRAVMERVEAGDAAGAQALVEPLHPADVADLIEAAARDEREGLVKALAGIVSPDVLAELNDWVREDLLEEARQAVRDSLAEAAAEGATDFDTLRRHVRQAAGRFVNERTKRRPMIVPIVMEV